MNCVDCHRQSDFPNRDALRRGWRSQADGWVCPGCVGQRRARAAVERLPAHRVEDQQRGEMARTDYVSTHWSEALWHTFINTERLLVSSEGELRNMADNQAQRASFPAGQRVGRTEEQAQILRRRYDGYVQSVVTYTGYVPFGNKDKEESARDAWGHEDYDW